MNDIDNLELYNKLIDVMDVDRIDKNRRVAHVACPSCGKPPRDRRDRPANHFSFGDFDGRWFGHCFKCKHSTSLYTLFERITGKYVPAYVKSQYSVTTSVRNEPAAPFWQPYANELVDSYKCHASSEKLWRTYKPFSRNRLLDLSFGVGILPYTMRFGRNQTERHFIPMRIGSDYQTLVLDENRQRVAKVDNAELFARIGRRHVQHQERLIVPVRNASGRVGALHGRSLNHSEKRYKWLACSGSDKKTPWGISRINQGDVVWIGENYVDAAMVNGVKNGTSYRAIGVGGVGLLRNDIIAWLKERQPSMVIVALDNDLAGQANEITRKALVAEEASERGVADDEVVTPMLGLRLHEQLRAAGFNAALFRWPDNAPPKAGLDWAAGVCS